MTAPETIKRPHDDRTHAAIDTGYQILTKCGLRGTYWIGDPVDQGTGVVDCPACLEELERSDQWLREQQAKHDGNVAFTSEAADYLTAVARAADDQPGCHCVHYAVSPTSKRYVVHRCREHPAP